ncbi:MAG: hypothetical protein U9Q40_04115 [Campylobacterota bacterium]|nr:hypothetical protein [Campylobacterota bacterium]
MNKKTSLLFYIFSVLVAILLFQTLYLSSEKSMQIATKEKKVLFVGLTGLPDLALASQSLYIRHRSLSLTSDIYSLDGSLREYDKSTYSVVNSPTTRIN